MRYVKIQKRARDVLRCSDCFHTWRYSRHGKPLTVKRFWLDTATLVSGLLLISTNLNAQQFPVKYRGLVDSLTIAVKASPAVLIYERPKEQGQDGLAVLGDYNPTTGVMRLSPVATWPRHRLAHEFGHLLQFTNQALFFEWFDSTGRKTADRIDLEHFAEDFADVFEAHGVQKGRRAVIARWLQRQ